MAYSNTNSNYTRTLTNTLNQWLSDTFSKSNIHRVYQPVRRTLEHVIVSDNGIDQVEAVKRFVIHHFTVSSNLNIYAIEENITKWASSEKGVWVMENAIHPPIVNCMLDPMTLNFNVRIIADFTGTASTWLALSEKIPSID